MPECRFNKSNATSKTVFPVDKSDKSDTSEPHTRASLVSRRRLGPALVGAPGGRCPSHCSRADCAWSRAPALEFWVRFPCSFPPPLNGNAVPNNSRSRIKPTHNQKRLVPLHHSPHASQASQKGNNSRDFCLPEGCYHCTTHPMHYKHHHMHHKHHVAEAHPQLASQSSLGDFTDSWVAPGIDRA